MNCTYHDFQPGDGTRYSIVCAPDPHGGTLVIWPGYVTYRYHRGDILKHLHGEQNDYTHKAIWEYLEALP